MTKKKKKKINRWREQIATVIGMMKKGVSIPEIEEEVGNKYGLFGETFQQLLVHTYKEWDRMVTMERKHMYNLHMNRYERHYRKGKIKLEALGESYHPDKFDSFIIEVNTCLQALRGKEAMMGFHETNFKLVLNQNTIIVHSEAMQGVTNRYQHMLKSLTFDEKKELRVLLDDARLTLPDGVWPLNKVKAGEELQDIEFVEVEKDTKLVDLPENVVKQMKVEKDVIPPEEPKAELLDNITKSLERKSKEQLLNLLNKNKEKKK